MYDRNTGPEVDMLYPMAPVLILNEIDDYARNHNPKGHFLTAVLENNLFGAVAHADPESTAGLRDIILYICREIPGSCHGSKEKVEAWLAQGKLTNRGPWPR